MFLFSQLLLLCVPLSGFTISHDVFPDVVGNYGFKYSDCLIGDVVVRGNYAYLACHAGKKGLQILNVSNISSPKLVGGIDAFAHRLFKIVVSGGYAYTFDDVGSFYVIDISIPSSPKKVSIVNNTVNSDFFIHKNLAFLIKEKEILIYDISDPASLVIIGSYKVSDITPQQVVADNDYVYVAGFKNNGGLSGNIQIIDITNTASPRLVGQYETEKREIEVSGFREIEIALVGQYLYFINRDSKVKILDVSNHAAPSLAGVYTASSSLPRVEKGETAEFFDIFVSKNHAYALYAPSEYVVSPINGKTYLSSSGSGGMLILDIKNPSSPKQFDAVIFNDEKTLAADDYLYGWHYALNNLSIYNPVRVKIISDINKSVIVDSKLIDRLKGRILLQKEGKGETWYIDPIEQKRYYLGRPADMLRIMKNRGIGIANSSLKKIPTSKSNQTGDLALRRRLSGKILLQVQAKGEAWYVNPTDLKRYYLGKPADAFRVIREKALGISDSDLAEVLVSVKSETPK